MILRTGCLLFCWALPTILLAAERPNVLLIITDDQGHGDLGFHGNPKIKTPNLDRLAAQSVQLKNFYVCPVCSPTRASLMTGRYNYRTGVVDTFIGRSMMHADEVTVAELLAAAGYRTGIFGKWHLGDNYPMRPQDQGFQEVLVHRGGGIGQPADPPGNLYFDPILSERRAGKEPMTEGEVRTKGYCSDVFTDAAIRFIREAQDHPFFAYVAFNCPHDPLQVPESYLRPYQAMPLSHSQFPQIGQPLPGQAQQEIIARVYAMVTNIDDNLGRLFAALAERKLEENTLVIFLTDNGPQQVRYVSGMRERKGSVFDGGIHVPCFLRWPKQIKGGKAIDRIAAHIDLAPTILEACGVSRPPQVAMDGRSLLPLLREEKANWSERTIYTQWHRGDEPELYRAFMAREQKWKLVQPTGRGPNERPKPQFLLFDMESDPYETNDLSGHHPDIVARMKRGYEDWFRDVSSTRGFRPPRIVIGSDRENPSVLTRQDWRGSQGWGPKDIGHWEVWVERPGRYTFRVLAAPLDKDATALLDLSGEKRTLPLGAGTRECTFENVELAAGNLTIAPAIEDAAGNRVGVQYVHVRRQ